MHVKSSNFSHRNFIADQELRLATSTWNVDFETLGIQMNRNVCRRRSRRLDVPKLEGSEQKRGCAAFFLILSVRRLADNHSVHTHSGKVIAHFLVGPCCEGNEEQREIDVTLEDELDPLDDISLAAAW